MKMVIGYISAFLSMTAIASLFAAGILIFVVALGSFVVWQLPMLEWEALMIALRICIGIGSIFGFFFIFSEEGQQAAKDGVELFEKVKATKNRVTEVNINE